MNIMINIRINIVLIVIITNRLYFIIFNLLLFIN